MCNFALLFTFIVNSYVKPDKEMPQKSVFVFRVENDIEKVLAEITYKK